MSERSDGTELPPLDADVVAELERLGEALDDRRDHADLVRRYEWLIDVLVLRGQLPGSFRRHLPKIRAERSTVRLAMFRDKYAVPNAEVDCADRIALCGARCCAFEVTLSAQDVAERRLPFQVDEPYVVPKDPATGRCVCMGPDGACTVYDHRPGTCRAYDCRHDRRIWLDFDARIPAPTDR